MAFGEVFWVRFLLSFRAVALNNYWVQGRKMLINCWVRGRFVNWILSNWAVTINRNQEYCTVRGWIGQISLHRLSLAGAAGGEWFSKMGKSQYPKSWICLQNTNYWVRGRYFWAGGRWIWKKWDFQDKYWSYRVKNKPLCLYCERSGKPMLDGRIMDFTEKGSEVWVAGR